MDYHQRIITDIECHSVDGIRECFANGVDANELFRDEPLFNELTSEYARTPQFAACVQAFIDGGLRFENKELLAVLADDAAGLQGLLNESLAISSNAYSLRSAYTPLFEATLLHVCAEFNHVACAKVLIQSGADINARAGMDEHGFGGQTPIFHTVNQNHNNSAGMLDLLLEHGADAKVTVAGLIWGKGYPWETLIPAVNPVSYAMMGLLPQMHRSEKTISGVVERLIKYAYGIDYTSGNVPNKYLQ